VILGTAGHVDHGKTSLIEALTGINTSRLKEERARGITIELGFAWIDIGAHRVGIVDVPGHERFIRHMVAGAGGLDLVLMVVAADEGIMPQTREHLEICRLMGVRRGIVVLTKIDLVDEEWLLLVEDDLRTAFKDTFLHDAAILHCSVKNEATLDRTRAALTAWLKDNLRESRTADNVPRLPIDRVFTLKGFGTIVTGTLLGGPMALGDDVEITPGDGKETKIRKLTVHGEDLKRVMPGSRVAINLPGIAHNDVHRGDLVAPTGRLQQSLCFDAELEVLPHVDKGIADRAPALLHTLTRQVNARIILIQEQRLAPGETALVQIRTQEAVTVIAGDRFVLRGFENLKNYGKTIAGGRVLDPLAPRFRRRHLAAHAARLQALASDDAERAIMARAELAGVSGIRPKELLTFLPFPLAKILAVVAQLTKRGELLALADTDEQRFARSALDELRLRLQRCLEEHHQASPHATGIGKEEARTSLRVGLDKNLFDRFLLRFEKERWLSRYGEALRLARLPPPRDEHLENAMTAAFDELGMAGVAIEEIQTRLTAPLPLCKVIAKRLIDEGRLIRIRPDMIVSAPAWENAVSLVQRHFSEHPQLSIGELRDLTGLSRKHLIPVAELLDRKGYTRRDGDLRLPGPRIQP